MRRQRHLEPGPGGGAEGNPPTPSVSPGRADFGGINGSSSSSSNDSSTSGKSGNSNDSGDLPAPLGRPARDLEVFVELLILQSGCTRSQSRGLTMSASCADALLAYITKAVEAKRAVEGEAAEIERAHDSLLEGRLEKEREWLEELERRGAVMEQREEEQTRTAPLQCRSNNNPSQVFRRQSRGSPANEVEPPQHTVAGVKRFIYRMGCEQAMQSNFEGHMKTGTFSMVTTVPEGCKPVGSKWCFDYKTDKEGKITKFKVRLVARGFRQIRHVGYTHSSPPSPSSVSIKLVLAVANKRGLPLYHFDIAQAYIRVSLDEEVNMNFPAVAVKS